MSRSPYLKTVTIIAALILTIIAPIIASGLLSAGAASAAVTAGDYHKASVAFESAARKLPWNQQLWELAGLAAYQSGDHASAIRFLNEARTRAVLSATGWEVLGSSQWAFGLPAAAMGTWEGGARLYPDSPDLLDRLAAAYHALRDYDAEQDALERRIKVEDDAAARYRLALLLVGRDDSSALANLEAATKLDEQVLPAAETLRAAVAAARREHDASASLVVIGRSLGLLEEWELAARTFGEAADLDPANAQARAWLGEARQHINENGRLDLDEALKLDPNDAVVHTLRGLYWRRTGNLGMSLAEYARAAALDPANAGLQSLLGEAYTASGDLVAALEAYESAVELAPKEATYWRMLALFSAENEVQVLDLGVAAGLEAVRLAPNDPRNLDALGWAYAQAGYLTKAEETLSKAVRAAPDFGDARLHLGITYLRWGQNDLAQEHLSEAARIEPDGAAGKAALQLLQTYFAP